MTEETINKLESVFGMGGTDREACFYANISQQTLYDYQKNHPEFIERKEALKNKPILKARQIVVQSLDDPKNAQWYLERRDPDFKPKQEFGFDKKYDNALSEVKGVILLASGKNYDSTAQLESPIQGRSAESVDTDTGPAGDFGDNTAPETS